MAGFQIDMSPLERSSRNIGQSLVDIGQTVGTAIQQSRQRDIQQQEQGDIEAFMQQAMSGDPSALKELMVKSPQAYQQVTQYLQQQQATIKAGDELQAGERLKANQETIKKLYRVQSLEGEAKVTAIQEILDNPSDDFDESDLQFMNDPKYLNASAVELFGADDAKAMFGGLGGGDSLPAEAVGFNDLIKDFTPEQQKLAKQVKAGLKGRAVSNAELSAIQSGEIDNYGKWKVDQKQAEKFAELTGSSRAKAIDKGFETIVKIGGAVRNYDRAISAIKGGAGVGVLEKFWPSIKAASVELDNIRGSMALDVVGATTFGALSKGELDLAKDVALPTGLDSVELVDYLERKKVAQKKLRDYYSEQIQFLDNGGTLAGFMRSKERGQTQEQSQPVQQQAPAGALQMLQQNPAFADQFEAKFGYLPEGF